jgi:hypothetical protein
MGSIELYWIPVGADGNPAVRWGGRLYEWFSARRAHRTARPLFHSALLVRPDAETSYAIEMAPVWSSQEPVRGVVAEGPVGLPWLGRSRMFRYEVRRWRGGTIPDLAAAVGGPVDLDATDDQALRLLALVPSFPTLTWGLDESRTGDMWNSNSLVSWLLASTGLSVDDLVPPQHGRAPGWAAGVAVARRTPARTSRSAGP